MEKKEYVHGYSDRETVRLKDQAGTLNDFLHNDTRYPKGSLVLEAGCGVGAQTIILAKNNPDSIITSIDISPESIKSAENTIKKEKIKNVTFQVANIFDLPFENEKFDHIFLCFVLEHLPNPVEALESVKKVLKRDGTITVIEGDHGSTYFYPESKAALQTINCLIDIQAKLKGDSLIGRALYPLLKKANYNNIRVSPRMIYVDSSKPHLVEGFTKNTFIAMVEGVKNEALSQKMIDEKTWDKGIKDLYNTTLSDGTFCYTFFKAIATK